MSEEEEEFQEDEDAIDVLAIRAEDDDEEPLPLQAKVAQILNTTDLALNKGSRDGVRAGMKFAILNPKGQEIRDPDSKEVLGSIDLAKTLVKIVSVNAGVSVARTFRSKTTGFSIAALGLGGTTSETLRSSEKRLQQELNEKDSYVKIGDVAVQYSGEFSGIVYEF